MEQAAAQQRGTVKELCALAKGLIDREQYDEAEKRLAESLEIEETSEAWRHLSVIHAARKDTDKTLACLERALDIDIEDAAALSMMGEALLETTGDVRQAMGHYILAVKAAPQERAYKERFLALAGGVPFAKYNEHVETALLACLQTPDLDVSGAQLLWYTLFSQHPQFSKAFRLSNQNSYVAFNKKAFDKLGDYSFLLRPFFLLGISRLIVTHPVFEEFLTHLRGFLLGQLEAKKPAFAPQDYAALAGALANYAFVTEYIFDATPEERKKVEALKSRLETEDASMKDARLVSIYACYAPLYGLSSAQKIVDHFEKDAALSSVVRAQISDWRDLQKIKGEIRVVTPVEDEVSAKVREQYEEFPYPRWLALETGDNTKGFLKDLNQKGRKILIAGCGTGREALGYAASLPEAEVLAIDISLSSLAYATAKARQYNVTNIKFGQADILKLGVLGEKFDYIACSGVLHHMKDPLAGWKVLTGLLKDDGAMFIALYSEIARQDIVHARAAAAKGKYAGDREGMLAFRRDSQKLLDRHDLISLYHRSDYYSLSMYRDLIFHTQEHRLTLPQIAESLKTLGLKLVRFAAPEHVLALYKRKYPDDPEMRNLGHWHELETQNPETFADMYQFWCKKA